MKNQKESNEELEKILAELKECNIIKTQSDYAVLSSALSRAFGYGFRFGLEQKISASI